MNNILLFSGVLNLILTGLLFAFKYFLKKKKMRINQLEDDVEKKDSIISAQSDSIKQLQDLTLNNQKIEKESEDEKNELAGTDDSDLADRANRLFMQNSD